MCPLKLVPRIDIFDEEMASPEIRLQRTLYKSKAPESTKYIIDSPN
ncbi:hypothetical protein EHM76_00490 [bacterium]|nr:MAG: hypothetical protein EHM76_00490 [bacterium]